ncbi:hypothetical protein K523DRAFT_375053 [Schizophyllum commune Tattone D]|nr:hypothetical protein K523DRAFT_375053 [Schizophyllum commune Tattone D]
MILYHLRLSTNSFFALTFATMYQSNQRSCLPLRAPASQHGANRFAPYCPPPYILFAPRMSTIPLPYVSPVLNNAGPVTSMLASSAQTLPSQVIPTNLPNHLSHQSQPVQQGPPLLTTAASARPSLSKSACHSSVVPHDSAPSPATSDAMPAQPVAGATRQSSIANADSPSLPSAADAQDTADNAETRFPSSASCSASASDGSSSKDGHVELSGTESFAGGICVLPVLAPWETIRSLTVTCPITINDLHLDTKKARCRVEINVDSLRQLCIGNVQTPIGSIFDDLVAPNLQSIFVAYPFASSALIDDEPSYSDFLERNPRSRYAGVLVIVSDDDWYRHDRAHQLHEHLQEAGRSTWIVDVRVE